MERTLKKQGKQPLKRRGRVDEMTSLLVQELMNAATSFHKLHLHVNGPGSYAQHKALGDLYESLPKLADDIAEGYQGACEVLLDCNVKMPTYLKNVEEAVQYMRHISEAVTELQSIMPHSEIVNQLDLVKDSINSAKYKLIFLS
jgi:DNA-binding ferritin-like protein